MKTWFITGATRGIGLAIARAALDAGDRVVATGRSVEPIENAFGRNAERLLATVLDVTVSASMDTAVDIALKRFGTVDVLVNNAGYGQLGAFEEVSPGAVMRQFAVNVFGTFEVTRRLLPHMRAQRSGRIITISSMAGFMGLPGAPVYCASKFALSGWSEALARELKPFGITSTVVYPGYFRTDFLDASSLRQGDIAIADYADQSEAARKARETRNHHQAGDPARLGLAIVELANAETPPVRFAAGPDALDALRKTSDAMREEADAWSALSGSTDFPEGD